MVFFFGESGDEFYVGGGIGDRDPGAAAAVFGIVGEGPGRSAKVDAEEGEVEAGGFVIVEALADDVVVPDVEGAEGECGLDAGDSGGPLDAGEVGDGDFAGGIGGDGGGPGKAGAGDLLVEEGGEEVELGMFEGKSVAPLVDAALAQDDGLSAGAEGFADDGPFFEGNAHGC